MTADERTAVQRLITAAKLESRGVPHHGFTNNYEWFGRSAKTWQELRDAIANAEQMLTST